MEMEQSIGRLEAPSEPRDAPEAASEGPGKGDVPPEEKRRSWWQRLFGF